MQNFLGMAEAAGGVPDVGNMAVEHTDPGDQSYSCSGRTKYNLKKFSSRAVNKEKIIQVSTSM